MIHYDKMSVHSTLNLTIERSNYVTVKVLCSEDSAELELGGVGGELLHEGLLSAGRVLLLGV